MKRVRPSRLAYMGAFAGLLLASSLAAGCSAYRSAMPLIEPDYRHPDIQPARTRSLLSRLFFNPLGDRAAPSPAQDVSAHAAVNPQTP